MLLVFRIGEILLGLWLMIAGLVYLVDHERGERGLKSAGVFALLLFIGLPIVTQIACRLGELKLALLAIIASFTAYLIREHRKPKRSAPPRPPGGERKPLVPRTLERPGEREHAGDSNDEMAS